MGAFRKLFLILIISLPLQGCNEKIKMKDHDQLTPRDQRREEVGRLFGDNFLLFGGAPDKRKKSFENQLRVDPFLWRASLETIEFMPLSSVDGTGGIIITDWYQTPKNTNERLKLTIQITDNYLHANAIKVIMHKQVKQGAGWVNSPVSPTLVQGIEEVILDRARQLKTKA